MIISELMMINAWVGFCRMSGSTWPQPLAALGYDVVGLERQITTSVDGRSRNVVPDVICASVTRQHALCVEAKVKTLSVPQADGYMAMTPTNLIHHGGLPGKIAPGRLTHDVTFATSLSVCDDFCRALDENSVSLPVVAGDESQFLLARGQLCQQDLNAVFVAGVPLPDEVWPTHFVPFTSSSELHEIAPHVLSRVQIYIRKNRSFLLGTLLSQSVELWDLRGQNEQRAIRDKVKQILTRAAAEELNDYLHLEEGKTGRWTVTAHRQSKGKSNRRDEAVQKRIRSFLLRLEHEIPFKPGQLILNIPSTDIDG